MKQKLLNWRHAEEKLAETRKRLCDRGYTAEAALKETAEDQRRNNRHYDNLAKKACSTFNQFC